MQYTMITSLRRLVYTFALTATAIATAQALLALAEHVRVEKEETRKEERKVDILDDGRHELPSILALLHRGVHGPKVAVYIYIYIASSSSRMSSRRCSTRVL